MKYIVLLRKINVGKENRVSMKTLEDVFVSLGYKEVATYINSGNVIFKTTKSKPIIIREIDNALFELFKSRIQFVIKTSKEMEIIRDAIPKKWENDNEQKTDIAYLFDEIDKPGIINELPIKKEFVKVIYIKGALIWNVTRKNLIKSQLSKIAGNKLYKQMTIRNVNTARHLSNISEC
jgi:uncharacterized protein (DUF1697 family)